jgi:hypothetical protein
MQSLPLPPLTYHRDEAHTAVLFSATRPEDGPPVYLLYYSQTRFASPHYQSVRPGSDNNAITNFVRTTREDQNRTISRTVVKTIFIIKILIMTIMQIPFDPPAIVFPLSQVFWTFHHPPINLPGYITQVSLRTTLMKADDLLGGVQRTAMREQTPAPSQMWTR